VNRPVVQAASTALTITSSQYFVESFTFSFFL
jgi:hypothetical protein